MQVAQESPAVTTLIYALGLHGGILYVSLLLNREKVTGLNLCGPVSDKILP